MVEAGAVGTVGAAGAVGAAAAASAVSARSADLSDHSDSASADAGSSAISAVETPAAAGSQSEATSSASGATASSAIQPSAKLAGQDDLASRKGSWRYEGGDGNAADVGADAAVAKAETDAAAAAAKAKAEADAAAKAKADADAAAKAKADADAAAKAKADADAAAKAKADADAAKAKAEADAGYAASAPVGGTGKGTRPAALASARGGKADDLKRINGVGPKLEGTLNGMGVYHFDQIAGWSNDELDWVDDNLEGFYGRASRDEWIPQAKVLAGQTAETGNSDYDGDGILEGKDEGTKPATLTAARGGKADNLKEIKGIGPKMEKLCNKLGFYHFDQIASWTQDEVAWVDANLEGFRGRVTRDEWVAQAKILATGGETEFSKRVEDGGVY